MSKIMDAMPQPPDAFEDLVQRLDDMDRDHHHGLSFTHQENGRSRALKRAWQAFRLAVQEAIKTEDD